jgi:Polyketide cyclase / dehydrase and lipid transport
MSDIRVTVFIDTPPAAVWEEVRHVDRHVEWMADAAELRFVGEERDGVGARFDVVTRVGPLRTTDRMEITEWEEGAVMGVRHSGAVTGAGRFTLAGAGRGTEFVWEEDLTFPWFFAGRAGARAARPLLRWIWRRNLAALKARVEAGAA